MQVRRAHPAQRSAGVRGGHGGDGRHRRHRSCGRDERSCARDGHGGGCDGCDEGGRDGVDIRFGWHAPCHMHLPLELRELTLSPPQGAARRRRWARGPLSCGGGTHLSLQLVQLVRVRELGLGLREVEG